MGKTIQQILIEKGVKPGVFIHDGFDMGAYILEQAAPKTLEEE